MTNDRWTGLTRARSRPACDAVGGEKAFERAERGVLDAREALRGARAREALEILVVYERRDADRRGLAVLRDLGHVRDRARAAARDHRHRHARGDRRGQLAVEAVAGAFVI